MIKYSFMSEMKYKKRYEMFILPELTFLYNFHLSQREESYAFGIHFVHDLSQVSSAFQF